MESGFQRCGPGEGGEEEVRDSGGKGEHFSSAIM